MLVAAVEGERLRFRVRTPRRGSDWHLVDLEAFDGSGICDCPHHRCRVAPRLRRREESSAEARAAAVPLCCKHVEAALLWFARYMVRSVVAEVARAHPNTSPARHNEHE